MTAGKQGLGNTKMRIASSRGVKRRRRGKKKGEGSLTSENKTNKPKTRKITKKKRRERLSSMTHGRASDAEAEEEEDD